ncbi:S2/P23 family protein [Borreliella afzelii]|uniref:S2/P23 family protein n=1 Tax=Borreliella afzelii TaxID=29518 RepID=UPI003AF939A0
MKKSINILNIFFFISLLYSCVVGSNSLKNTKTGILNFELIEEDNEKDITENIKKDITENIKKDITENIKNIFCNNEEFGSSEIKEGEVYGGLFAGYVTWAKSGNLRAIKDRYNNLIEGLKGLKYSYIFSPIQFKTSSWFSYSYYINDNNYKILGNEVPIAKIIAFESTKEFEKKYEVKSLKLISEGVNFDFEQYRTDGFAKITLKEVSREAGYINSYNFGVFNNALTDFFTLFYKKSKCSYMLAYLTIKDRQTNEDKTYEIVLDIKLFNDVVKLIFAKYPDLSKEKLKLPIDLTNNK